MVSEDATSRQWRTLAPIDLEQISDEDRNDYFYGHRPHEHFIRSLAVLRLITTRGQETLDLAQGLDESWLLAETGPTQGVNDVDGDTSDAVYVIIQGLTLKFLAVETLLRHFLAHLDSPSEPWSHISQLKVPRQFSERLRQLLTMRREARASLTESIFFGVTEATRSRVLLERDEWAQQITGVDTFLEMCLRCWLEDQGPFLAIKHGYVAIPHEVATISLEQRATQQSAWSRRGLRYITRGADAGDWEFQAASLDEPNTTACEIYFASRLLRQLLDVGRIRNVPSEARTIDVIWWDAELCERVRNGTLDIADGPPPTRPWTVPQ